MSDTVEKVTASISNALDRVVDITHERLFSPMYFYFFTAWIVINWPFVYTLLFIDNDFLWQNQGQMKVEYLAHMYSNELIWPLYWSALYLVILPAIAAFAAIWWFSRLSEMFHKRYEEHQMNKRVILREIEYREKVGFAKQQREVRDQELDKKDIKYEDNDDYNQSLDNSQATPVISGISYRPSEVLYNTDYQAYKEGLEEYNDYQVQKGEDLAVQEEIDKRRGK